MFDLNRKIEEIRRQPEHIRMRYVWGSVAICMMLIFMVWVFSIKENFKKSNDSNDGVSPFSEIKQDISQEVSKTESAKDTVLKGSEILKDELSE